MARNNERTENYLNKPLPSSDESEKLILGAILLDNDMIYDVVGKLKPEQFYSPLYRRIYAAMLNLLAAGKSIDPILIGEELKKEGSIDSIGGITVITNITFGLPHFSDITEYVNTVIEKSMARDLIRLTGRIQSDALSEEEDIHELIDKTEQEIYELRHQQVQKGFATGGDLALASANKIKDRALNGVVDVLGIPSGLKDLDALTSGFEKKDLILIAARPSMGKTSLALQFCLNATAYDPNFVGAFFSLEMSQEQLINRLLCMEARIDSTRYRKGHLMSKEWDRLAAAVDTIQRRNIFIDEQPKLTVLEMKARARKLKAQKKRLDFIFVDHLGLAKGSGRKERRLELGEISKDLKAMAKELDAVVFALCQLSRKPEGRSDNRPMSSDIRESGEIEEDADTILMLYRDEYYKKTTENAGKAEIIIGKNRNGPTETVHLTFINHFMRFEDTYRG